MLSVVLAAALATGAPKAPVFSALEVTVVAQARMRDGLQVVASPQGLLSSRDGLNFSPAPGSPQSILRPGAPAPIEALLALAPSTALAADDFGRIYRSDDGGASWTPSHQGLPSPFWRRTSPVLLAQSPTHPETVYAVLRNPVHSERNDTYLFRSIDAGRTWVAIEQMTGAPRYDSLRVREDNGPVVDLTAAGKTYTLRDHQARSRQPVDLWTPDIEPERIPTPNPPGVADYDDAASGIAVLFDDGTFVSLNDLAGRRLRIRPLGGTQYRTEWLPATVAIPAPATGALNLVAETRAARMLGGNFPFFGVNQRNIWISSNGSVTFTADDPKPDFSENLGQFRTGPPRIAVLWDNFDPLVGGGDVYFESDAAKTTITWYNVTEKCPFLPCTFPPTSKNTFRLDLITVGPNTGEIYMSWDTLSSRDGLVGLSPGGNPPSVALTDLTLDGPFTSPPSLAFGEQFTQDFFATRVAKRFYHCHPDTFDQLVVWGATNYPNFVATESALNSTIVVKNSIPGLGLRFADPDRADNFNHTASYGSLGRLGAFLNMGLLADYFDPNPTVKIYGDASALDLLGEATGRRWGAYLRTANPDPLKVTELLGSNDTHWSFFHNTDASVLHGNRWVPGALPGEFQTSAADDTYGPLDRYLMFGAPVATGSAALIDFTGPAPACAFPPGACDRFSYPQVGVTVTGGSVRSIPMTQIQTVNGIRSATGQPGDEPRPLRQAWILVVPPGTAAPSPADLTKLSTFKTAWLPYFANATGAMGTIDPTISFMPRRPGKLGNSLRMIRSGYDVIFDWKTGVLDPGRYVIYGTAAKVKLIDDPVTGIGSQLLIKPSDLERAEDRFAIDQRAKPVYFYEVWGRDCADLPVFN